MISPLCARLIFSRCTALISLAVTVLWPLQIQAQTDEFRAYWADAFHAGFMNSNQVTTLINTARAGNFNALIVEVRKRGDAYYNSNFEPKATDVSPPSFDPLADLIAKAHDTSGGKQRIEVHAWVVTYHIWNPSTSNGVPSQPNHPYNLHPDWLMKDVNDATYIGGQYTFDQGHPGTQKHTYNVAMDIVSNYDVDGINFDYVRYSSVNEGYNDVTVARFNQLYGRTGKPAPADAGWKQFRRDQISALMRKIYLNTVAIKPQVKVSADTICFAPGVTNLAQWFSSSAAWNSVLQDWRGWMEEGIIDMTVPMAYFRQNTGNSNDWAKWSIFAKDFKYNRHAVIGPGIYLNTISNSIYQIRSTRDLTPGGNRAEGVSLYSYAVVDAIANAGNLQTQLQERALFQSAITTNGASVYDSIAPGVFSEKVNTPPMPWKTAPTKGHLKGFVFNVDTNNPIDGAILTLSGAANKTMTNDATGFYGAVDLIPGHYTLTATFAGLDPISTNITIVAGNVFTADFILSDTTAPTISGILITNLSNTSATIIWNTDEMAGSILEYGADSDYGLLASNVTLTSSHSIHLSGLFPCTTYHFRVKSVDGSANETVSEDLTFSTGAAGVVSDLILDNPDANYSGLWTAGTAALDKYGSYYQFAATTPGNATSEAVYRPNILMPGKYNVYIWYTQGTNRTSNAQILIVGNQSVSVTQIDQTTGGGGWRLIGSLKDFTLGTNGFVRLSNNTGEASRIVVADAVRFEFIEAPCISSQPQSQTVPAGTNLIFQVTAHGTGTLTYQWQFNGENLFGATSNTLALSQVAPADGGDYSVIVSNPAGSAASVPANLFVNAAPAKFNAAALLPNRQIRFSLTGSAGVVYRIDASTNLVNWVTVTNIFNIAGAFEFIDSTGTNAQRFYRAIWSP